MTYGYFPFGPRPVTIGQKFLALFGILPDEPTWECRHDRFPIFMRTSCTVKNRR